MIPIVIGLGFGDEGKGAAVDYLCRKNKSRLVVKFNGGSQAGHNVVADDKHFTFAQFGSGTFAGAKTLLSKHVYVDPISLVKENRLLSKHLGRFALANHFIDGRAPIITPFHVSANRIREYCRENRHGSCGKGHGETVKDYLTNEPLLANELSTLDDGKLRTIQQRMLSSLEQDRDFDFDGKVKEVRENLPDEYNLLTRKTEPHDIGEVFRQIAKYLHVLIPSEVNEMLTTDSLVFEGSQGVLLDENYGFYPNTTWSTTTGKNAIDILAESGISEETEVVGVSRTYLTRHGAGPFPSEITEVKPHANEHNALNDWQGSFRLGWLDRNLLQYAIRVCRLTKSDVNSIFLTHLDNTPRHVVDSYKISDLDLDITSSPSLEDQWFRGCRLNNVDSSDVNLKRIDDKSILPWMEEVTGLKVRYTSHGPTWKERMVIK